MMDSLHHTEQLLFQKHLEDILHDCLYRALSQGEREVLRNAIAKGKHESI